MHKNISLGLALFMILFIFSQSLLPGPVSAEQSGFITGFVHRLFLILRIDIELNHLSYLIRKAAHMIEFLILGIAWTNYSRRTTIKRPFIFIMLMGFGVAVIDESIQYFVPGRASSILDVGIDLVGYIIGVFLLSLRGLKKT